MSDTQEIEELKKLIVTQNAIISDARHHRDAEGYYDRRKKQLVDAIAKTQRALDVLETTHKNSIPIEQEALLRKRQLFQRLKLLENRKDIERAQRLARQIAELAAREVE